MKNEIEKQLSQTQTSKTAAPTPSNQYVTNASSRQTVNNKVTTPRTTHKSDSSVPSMTISSSTSTTGTTQIPAQQLDNYQRMIKRREAAAAARALNGSETSVTPLAETTTSYGNVIKMVEQREQRKQQQQQQVDDQQNSQRQQPPPPPRRISFDDTMSATLDTVGTLGSMVDTSNSSSKTVGGKHSESSKRLNKTESLEDKTRKSKSDLISNEQVQEPVSGGYIMPRAENGYTWQRVKPTTKAGQQYKQSLESAAESKSKHINKSSIQKQMAAGFNKLENMLSCKRREMERNNGPPVNPLRAGVAAAATFRDAQQSQGDQQSASRAVVVGSNNDATNRKHSISKNEQNPVASNVTRSNNQNNNNQVRTPF